MVNRSIVRTAQAAVLGVAALLAAPTVRADAPQPTVAGAPLDLALQKASTAEVEVTLTPLLQSHKNTVYFSSYQRHVHLIVDPAHNRLLAESAPVAAYPNSATDLPSILLVDGTRRLEFNGSDRTYTDTPAKPITSGEPYSSLFPLGLSKAMGWTTDTFVSAPDESLDGVHTLHVFLHEDTQPARDRSQPDEVLTRKVWVDPRTRLPVRVVDSRRASISAEDKPYQSIDFSEWRLNDPTADSRLSWTPPAGAIHVPARLRPFIGAQAPQMKVEKWGGGGLDLGDYRGKIVVLDFWSPSDGESRRGLGKIQEAIGRSGAKDVTVVAVCLDEDRATYDRWMAKNAAAYPFTFAYDPDNNGRNTSIRRTLGLWYVPTTLVLDRDGRIANEVESMPGDYVEQLTARLDKAASPTP